MALGSLLARWRRRSRPPPPPPDYHERRVEELRERWVPADDRPAATVQGELMRHAYYLYDDGYRRGFMNWADRGDAAIAFLRRHLIDPRVFDVPTITLLREALNRIEVAGPEAGAGLPVADLRLVLFRAVDWCDQHPQPQPLHGSGHVDVSDGRVPPP